MGLAHPAEANGSGQEDGPKEQKQLQKAMLRRRRTAPKHRVRMR